MAARLCSVTPLVFRLHESAPELVREVLLERGWVEYNEQEQEEGDWNLYWRASAFRNADYRNILPWQRLNHHPKTVSITRKDCLARNLKRMRGTFGAALYDFSPVAFILPNDYTRFLAEYTKYRTANQGRPGYWICKPVHLSRGRGIFIFEDIKDLTYDSSVIVQRYISDPLLISGYKFDLRIYVCVRSFHPLTIYIHQEGLVRFATEKYNLASLDNLYAHLTNTSINKFGPFYTTHKERVGQGCKWTMSKFRCFLHNQDVDELLFWQRINRIVTLTLLTVAPSIPCSPNCVELFGFDILIDASFKPWLLEVNYSPALSMDCPVDMAVKKALLNDLFDLMGYRKVDGLRQRGYMRQQHKHPPYPGSQSVQSTAPPLLLLPHYICESKPNTRCHSQAGFSTLHRDDPDYSNSYATLPLVEMKQTRSSQKRTGCNTCSPDGLHLKPSPKSKAAKVGGNSRTTVPPFSRKQEPSPRTDSMDTEPAFEYVGLSLPGSVKQSQGRSPPGFCKLPAIQICKYKPLTFPWDCVPQDDGRPPARVGDFILTFPFNEVTFKASRKELDVKTAVQEVHKLMNRLASPQSHRVKRRKEGDLDEWVERDGFGSLFWGPRNPPLLSECCSTR